MKKTLTILTVMGLLVACSPKFITPMQTDVDRVADKFPGYTLTDLKQGMTLYQTKCSMCHPAKAPRSHNEEQWRDIVPEMVQKANKKETRITPEEADAILKYVITMGKQ